MLLLMHCCCWCADAADAADALMLLMHWCYWCTDAADAMMLLIVSGVMLSHLRALRACSFFKRPKAMSVNLGHTNSIWAIATFPPPHSPFFFTEENCFSLNTPNFPHLSAICATYKAQFRTITQPTRIQHSIPMYLPESSLKTKYHYN